MLDRNDASLDAEDPTCLLFVFTHVGLRSLFIPQSGQMTSEGVSIMIGEEGVRVSNRLSNPPVGRGGDARPITVMQEGIDTSNTSHVTGSIMVRGISPRLSNEFTRITSRACSNREVWGPKEYGDGLKYLGVYV
jgi:hypothetical protein